MSSSPNSRYGRQPVADILRKECGWSVRFVANKVGVPELHLVNVVHGRSAPSPRVREALPDLVGRPLEELFTPESLAGQYLPQFGPGGPSRKKQAWAVGGGVDA